MFDMVDVKSFYASYETVFRPDLWGKPVVVLSNNDGCVIASSPITPQRHGRSLAGGPVEC